MDFVAPSQSLIDSVKELDHLDIHLCHLLGVMTPEEVIQSLKGFGIIVTGWASVGDIQPLPCMNIIKQKPPFRKPSGYQRLQEGRPAEG